MPGFSDCLHSDGVFFFFFFFFFRFIYFRHSHSFIHFNTELVPFKSPGRFGEKVWVGGCLLSELAEGGKKGELHTLFT